MTACVNRKHTKKVAAVVTASLVGALSLGVAPVAAMAEDTGIETLASNQSNVGNATVQYEDSTTTFYINGKGQGRVPVKVKADSGQEYDVDLRPEESKLKDGNFYYFYVAIGAQVDAPNRDVDYYDGSVRKALTGEIVTDGSEYVMPSRRGKYAVVVAQYKHGRWVYRDIADTFSIVGFSLNEAKLVDGKDATDTTFNYTGEAGSLSNTEWEARLGVAVGNHVLDEATDYDIDIYRKSDGVDMGTAAAGDLDLGVTYVAKITGTGFYTGTVEREFTIGKLDLSTAAIVPEPMTSAPSKTPGFNEIVESVNGVDDGNWGGTGMADSNFKVTLVSAAGSQIYNTGKGVFEYTVEAATGSKYITGKTTVKVVNADILANIDFSGCGTPTNSPINTEFVVNNSSDKPTYFDLSHIDVTVGGASITNYTTTVTDDEGNVVDMAGKTQLTDPGTYYVKVDVYYKNDAGQLIAGTKVAKVVVLYQNVVSWNDIFMTYKGQNVVSWEHDTYDGTDLSQYMEFAVKANDKVLAEGTDYTVTFEKQADDGTRTVVDEIVDAGVYIITVDGKTFDETAEFTFVVDALKLNKAVPVWDIDADDNTNPDGYLMYTGEVLNPAYRFFDTEGNEVEVPEGSYVVDHYEDEDGEEVELKEVGTYTAFFETAKDVVNYDFDGLESEPITVTDKGVFMDVPMAGQWYSQVVYDAVNLGYMNGYSGTKVFGPNDSITRGQVACVLFNMAGGEDAYSENLFWNNEIEGYETGFGDVSGKAYYAQAIAWAKATGVVNGYGDGTFKPDANITREEFAAMLSNYAEKLGDDVEGAEADLSAFGDASQVSDWATEAIEWAVANEVMGNGGFLAPTANITRAEAAAMAVNYQPEKLGDIVISVPDMNPTL
ncbi:S-layer homology domain-containing protein [Collinsella ihumii]|uniref:S-layer homology domain-containing protein n=1 Tax=Collinsella ihumii TaxID=1720204 RepID=A0AAW7JTH6_9ACTN|nr:S-layer homology domain-containing protein [Collinsella ihumii]MDN0070029.1 S-layer homology domain-containing protein [Collinsella ihumii]